MKAIAWAIILAALILKKEKNGFEIFSLWFTVGILFFSVTGTP